MGTQPPGEAAAQPPEEGWERQLREMLVIYRDRGPATLGAHGTILLEELRTLYAWQHIWGSKIGGAVE